MISLYKVPKIAKFIKKKIQVEYWWLESWERENGYLFFNGHEMSIWEDEVLEKDDGNGCKTM